jgi:ribosomal protein S25
MFKVTELVREVKKWKALRKLLEHVEKEPGRELRWVELTNILARAGISLSYAVKLIPELELYGILTKFERSGLRYYKVNVEKLREVVKALG